MGSLTILRLNLGHLVQLDLIEALMRPQAGFLMVIPVALKWESAVSPKKRSHFGLIVGSNLLLFCHLVGNPQYCN